MYQNIARYYDLLHDHLVADVDFLAGLAQETGGPLLELGCGTGRVLLPLARQGHSVVGVDASQAMLAIARTRLAEESQAVQARVTLERQDFSAVSFAGEFSLAIMAYNTVMHLPPADLASCLDNVRRSLAPGGRLFIDVENPAMVHDPGQDGLLLLERLVYDEAEEAMVALTVSSVGDGAHQTRETVWLVDVSPSEGGPVSRTVTRTTLHYYFAHQLAQQLEAAGFSLLSQYGDYDRRAYDADESDRLLLLAGAG